MQKRGGVGGRGGRLVAELRVEGGVWYGGCVQRIEGIVKCTLRCFTILRIINKSWGRGGGGRGKIQTQNTLKLFSFYTF